MSIAQLHDLSLAEQKAHAAKNGGYNDFPPNWEEVDAKTLAQSVYFAFYPVLSEFRQMHARDGSGVINPPINTPSLSAHLDWFFDGQGFAVVNDYWAGTVKFFRFGERNPQAHVGFDSSD
jgi:hypothetical protein